MLYSPSLPTDPNMLPTIGNGYIGTLVDSSSCYIAGVYNGVLGETPSHRARIPASIAIQIVSVETQAGVTTSIVPYASALDLERALFIRRYNVSGVHIEHVVYAHRSMPHVLVVDLAVTVTATTATPVKLILSTNTGSPSTDISLIKTPTDIPATHGASGQTVLAEVPGTRPTTLAYIASDVPTTLTIPAAHNASEPYRRVFLAAYRTGIDTDLQTDLWNATRRTFLTAQTLSPSQLMEQHTRAWAQLWASGGIEVSLSRLELAAAVNSSMYYLYSAVRQDRKFSLSPGGLTNGYNGHVFWDCETWMFPAINIFHPQLAESVLDYRIDRLEAAHEFARTFAPKHNWQGTMFPWESGYSGRNVCPDGVGTCTREQHITGDIAFAARQFLYMQQDPSYQWLSSKGMSLLQGIGEFWASRPTCTQGVCSINDVIPPDEYHDHVDNSYYTNYVAAAALNFSSECLELLGKPGNSTWRRIASELQLPFVNEAYGHGVPSGGVHLEFDKYQGDTIKQADIVLLAFPLGMYMTDAVRKNDLDYYAARTSPSGPAMTWGMYFIGYLDIGELDLAHSYFNRSYANIQKPFGVWTETPQGGTINFITGAGGFLQTMIYGWPGLRIESDSLVLHPKQLPEHVTDLKLRHVTYGRFHFDVFVDSVKNESVVTLVQDSQTTNGMIIAAAESDSASESESDASSQLQLLVVYIPIYKKTIPLSSDNPQAVIPFNVGAFQIMIKTDSDSDTDTDTDTESDES
jgi:protein-glucosylgalactosylhydroxylysine glucosidase